MTEYSLIEYSVSIQVSNVLIRTLTDSPEAAIDVAYNLWNNNQLPKSFNLSSDTFDMFSYDEDESYIENKVQLDTDNPVGEGIIYQLTMEKKYVRKKTEGNWKLLYVDFVNPQRVGD